MIYSLLILLSLKCEPYPLMKICFCFYLWVENLKQKLCKKVSTSNKVNYQVPLFKCHRFLIFTCSHARETLTILLLPCPHAPQKFEDIKTKTARDMARVLDCSSFKIQLSSCSAGLPNVHGTQNLIILQYKETCVI